MLAVVATLVYSMVTMLVVVPTLVYSMVTMLVVVPTLVYSMVTMLVVVPTLVYSMVTMLVVVPTLVYSMVTMLVVVPTLVYSRVDEGSRTGVTLPLELKFHNYVNIKSCSGWMPWILSFFTFMPIIYYFQAGSGLMGKKLQNMYNFVCPSLPSSFCTHRHLKFPGSTQLFPFSFIVNTEKSSTEFLFSGAPTSSYLS